MLHRAGRAAAKLESLDIPTVLFGRTDFLGVIRNAVSGLGFPPEAPVVAFPVDTFLPGSDLSSIADRRQEFYNGLTLWRSAANFVASGETAPRFRSEPTAGTQPCRREPLCMPRSSRSAAVLRWAIVAVSRDPCSRSARLNTDDCSVIYAHVALAPGELPHAWGSR